MTSNAPHPVAPRWVVAYLWITVAMAGAFSVLAYVNPGVQPRNSSWPYAGNAGGGVGKVAVPVTRAQM